MSGFERRGRWTATTMLYGVVGASFLSTCAWAGPNDFQWLSPVPVSSYAPAVDGVNARTEPFGGRIANRSIVGNQGAVTFPISGSLGAQIDAAFGSLDRRGFGNLAGHFFWRNPNQALFGFYASHTRWDQFGGAHVNQAAAEGEFYSGRFTVQGIAGIEWGNRASSASTLTSITPPGPPNFPFGYPAGIATTSSYLSAFDVKTRFFDQINFKYYFTDNALGYVGHRYLGGKHALALGGEYAFPIDRVMISAFVEARVGESNFNGVWGGLKFYFNGKNKPLLARHRQDDPNIWSADTLFSITNSATSSSSSSSTTFCNPGDFLISPGTCESGSF
ncbi:hypothetical protein [Bradyrhizobium sp.]|uniref:hypothetical protein n=1 Tax=Bradyrhizobium sp. TaxID=376 RepID=UPI001E02107B|nr:hypothetical protein [Bradyrhizobium sp.]MBI5321029.1 hypothetical protein [Bradyrhizobium sp.]